MGLRRESLQVRRGWAGKGSGCNKGPPMDSPHHSCRVLENWQKLDCGTYQNLSPYKFISSQTLHKPQVRELVMGL